MTNIIQFPRLAEPHIEVRPVAKLEPPGDTKGKGVFDGIVKTGWVMLALVWPILRWVIALDVVYQFARMVWTWHTPDTHGGWAFLLHFGILTALTYLVAHKPKGL